MRIERPGTDARVDEAIEGAVREMMQVDPPADLRARILARMEGPARARPMIPRLVTAAALAVVIVIAFIVMREPAPAPVSPPVAESVPGPVPDRASPPATTRDRDHAREVRLTGPHITPAVDATPPAPVFAPTITVATLEPIEPIAVAPLARPPVAPDGIVIEPLPPIAELEIAPLSPTDGWD